VLEWIAFVGLHGCGMVQAGVYLKLKVHFGSENTLTGLEGGMYGIKQIKDKVFKIRTRNNIRNMLLCKR
jgi:hypothetical protein